MLLAIPLVGLVLVIAAGVACLVAAAQVYFRDLVGLPAARPADLALHHADPLHGRAGDRPRPRGPHVDQSDGAGHPVVELGDRPRGASGSGGSRLPPPAGLSSSSWSGSSSSSQGARACSPSLSARDYAYSVDDGFSIVVNDVSVTYRTSIEGKPTLQQHGHAARPPPADRARGRGAEERELPDQARERSTAWWARTARASPR